jgi:putative intracellular protease/amidase
MAPKILIVLTSFGKFPFNGEPTGWYLPELAHPYDVFTEAGWEITVASPKGGEAPLDPSSVNAFKKDPSSNNFLDNHKDVWQKTAKVKDFLGHAKEYDALFYPGGHGPMYDLATDEDSMQLAREFYEDGKVVSAVCHGPAALANVKLSDGTLLLKGKEVAGFTDSEEGERLKNMPFSLQQKLNEASGGKFVRGEDWSDKTVVAGRVITGQNPASAKSVGQAIVKAVKAA